MDISKRRILFIIGAAYVSGLEVVTLHLIKGLKERGYIVRCLINEWNDGNFKSRLDDLGVEYDTIKLGWLHLRKPLWTLDSLIHYPKAYSSAKKIIADFKPDICHLCHYPMSVPLLSLINCKAVYNLQETHLPTLKHKWIYKQLNKKVSIFTAVSNHIVKVLEELSIPKSKIELIYNGIPPINSNSSNSTKDVINESFLHFAIIGQVVEWKGHGILIKAVEHLINRGVVNFKIAVYGNDNTDYGIELKETIRQKKLKNYFEWKGFVKDQRTIYENTGVVIVPSLSGEPCSLTIIESMTWGKGIIVSDRGGNPELVQNNNNGLVYIAEDHQQLSDCMYQLVQNRNQISYLGKAAQEKALAHYNYNIMTDAYVNVYENL
jgi:glycosyltransferase involved in cell wall biosynthesis